MVAKYFLVKSFNVNQHFQNYVLNTKIAATGAHNPERATLVRGF